MQKLETPIIKHKPNKNDNQLLTVRSQNDTRLPIFMLMITGGLAGCIGQILTIPLDTTKIRMQVQGKQPKYTSMLHCLTTIKVQEGILALYKGLSAGILRQMVYGSLRIGLYQPVKNFYQTHAGNSITQKEIVPLSIRIAAAVTTGSFGILIANPTDVLKVRFQADGRKSLSTKRYLNLRHAYFTIIKEQGIKGFWRGVGPNVIRNSVINCSEIVTFDMSNDLLTKKQIMEPGVKCHIVSSTISGVTACVIGSPVDVIKNRVMNAKKGQYSSVFHCIAQTFKEGPLTFYRGLQANAYRIISWNIVTFVSLGLLRSFFYGQRERNCKNLGF